MEIRKINLVAVALISSTIFWTSCSKDDDPVPVVEKESQQENNNDSTNESDNSDTTSTDVTDNSNEEVSSIDEVSYNMDGDRYALNKKSNWGSISSYSPLANQLTFNRGEGGFSFDELTITINGIDLDNVKLPMLFTTDASSTGVEFSYVQFSESSYYSDTFNDSLAPDFSLSLNSINGDVAKGTFFGTVYDDDKNPHTISEGSFELKFERK